MNNHLLASWVLFFVGGYALYGYMIIYVRNNSRQLYERWGKPGVFTASAQQAKLIQSFVFRNAVNPQLDDKKLVGIVRAVAFSETIYMALFVAVIMNIFE